MKFLRLPYATALLVMLAALAGCAAFQSPVVPSSAARAKVVGIAVAQVGAPYKYGGYDRTGFDDSGLVYFCYREAGYRLPIKHEGQLRLGQPTQFADAQPGDILFYRFDDGSQNENNLHAGVYLGNGEMVHASLKRDEVVSEVVDSPFWFQRLVAVIKILP